MSFVVGAVGLRARLPLPQLPRSPGWKRSICRAMTSAQGEGVDKQVYDSRWENMWKGDGATPLQPGQAFDGTKASAALTDLLTRQELGLDGKTVVVPGCGRGYDLEEFLRVGQAQHAVGLELAPTAVQAAKEYLASALSPTELERAEVIQADFFAHATTYDVGYDYTFLCALHPDMRQSWAAAWSRIVKPGGKLVTLIFPVDPTRMEGPPWAVTPELYKGLLQGNGFSLVSLSAVPTALSHKGREGKEFMAVWERST